MTYTTLLISKTQKKYAIFAMLQLECITGYQVIRVIRIFAKIYPFEWQIGNTQKNQLVDLIYLK